ncbi:unnamed protein product [Owenia fusiformis]|uniref:Uncharacterized protein n=1 Tax=Owenia fusiformis TaxID=6347 RepID=A0A8J1XF13_OWEFU|nr:unnamed protein product [Owenia fusiformis]
MTDPDQSASREGLHPHDETTGTFKPASKHEFRASVFQTMIEGYKTMTLALGYKLGLFDVMANLEVPATAEEIALKANCREKQTDEWLRAMSSEGYIKYDLDTKRYTLPLEHSKSFKENTGGHNIVTLFLEGLSVLACAFEDTAALYKRDGPEFLPPASKNAVAEWKKKIYTMPEWSEESVAAFVDSTPGLKAKSEEGIQVLDIGCGTGSLSIKMAKLFPRSEVKGVDLSEESIKKAKENVNVPNVSFGTADATELDSNWTEKFDYVVSSFVLHHVSPLTTALGEIRRVLKPGGWLSVMEFAEEGISHGDFYMKTAHSVEVLAQVESEGAEHHHGDHGHHHGDHGHHHGHHHGNHGHQHGEEKVKPSGSIMHGLTAVELKERGPVCRVNADTLSMAGFVDLQILEQPEDEFNPHYFLKKPL